MRRLDTIKNQFSCCRTPEGEFEDREWLVRRVERLEEALKAAKYDDMSGHTDDCMSFREGFLEPCDCGVDAHNACIDAVLNEDR